MLAQCTVYVVRVNDMFICDKQVHRNEPIDLSNQLIK